MRADLSAALVLPDPSGARGAGVARAGRMGAGGRGGQAGGRACGLAGGSKRRNRKNKMHAKKFELEKKNCMDQANRDTVDAAKKARRDIGERTTNEGAPKNVPSEPQNN